jgi:hypothetical protein
VCLPWQSAKQVDGLSHRRTQLGRLSESAKTRRSILAHRDAGPFTSRGVATWCSAGRAVRPMSTSRGDRRHDIIRGSRRAVAYRRYMCRSRACSRSVPAGVPKPMTGGDWVRRTILIVLLQLFLNNQLLLLTQITPTRFHRKVVLGSWI